jgi:hypothetical protein
LQASPGNAVGLGIFEGDNMEDRIMILTKKRKSLSRAGLIGLVLAINVTSVGVRCLRARRAGKLDHQMPRNLFAGTWHWMFQGKSFSTMTLTPNGSGFTGFVTESRIALNDDGG